MANRVRIALLLAWLGLIFTGEAQAQSAQSAAQLEKAGRLKEASEAYVSEALTLRGESAATLVKRAVQINPDSSHVLILLGSTSIKHPDPAVRSLAFFETGLIELVKKNYQKSRLAFRGAIESQPENWNARYLALALGLYSGELEALRSELDEAFRLGPPRIWFDRFVLLSAVWLGSDGRYSQALALLEEQVLRNEQASPESLALAVLFADRIPDGAKVKGFLDRLRKSHGSSSLVKIFTDGGTWHLDPLFLILGARLDGPPLESLQVARLSADQGPVIQLGLFSKEENAKNHRDRFASAFPDIPGRVEEIDGKFRVIVTVPKSFDPEILVLTLKEKGFEGFILTND